MDPPTFLSVRKTAEENVTWNEPIFYDNSGRPVVIKKSHSEPECFCPLGTTQIFYRATDAFNNSATCVLNVTVEGISMGSEKKIRDVVYLLSTFIGSSIYY